MVAGTIARRSRTMDLAATLLSAEAAGVAGSAPAEGPDGRSRGPGRPDGVGAGAGEDGPRIRARSPCVSAICCESWALTAAA